VSSSRKVAALTAQGTIAPQRCVLKLNNPNLWTAITFFVASGMQLGGYQSKATAYALFLISAALFLYSAFLTFKLPGGLLLKWNGSWALRFGGKLPLHIAAQIAYEAARKHGTLWAHAAEKLGTDPSPNGIIDYVATYFGMHVPIVGKRPPSTLDEVIDTKAAGKGTFEGGAQRLEMHDGHTVFTDLRVAAKDVKFVVAKMSEKVFPDGKW
jgi:hypothetical protein